MMIRRAGLVLVCMMLLVTPAGLDAQAICSTPHSSPSLAQGGSLGTLPPGSGSVQLSAYSQQVDDAFDTFGTRQAFFRDGRTTTRSLYATATLGVTPGVDVWAQASVHRLRFANELGEQERSGPGDVRLAIRASAELVGSSAPISLRAGVKIPGSTFPVEAIVPLSEGQTDVDMTTWADSTVMTCPPGAGNWRI